jgi:hypothetical protein
LLKISDLDVSSLPVREEVLDFLKEEAAKGRTIHLVNAINQSVASDIAKRFEIFQTVRSTEQDAGLGLVNRGARLRELFPGGFVYVWRYPAFSALATTFPQLSLIPPVPSPIIGIFNPSVDDLLKEYRDILLGLWYLTTVTRVGR